MTRFFEVGALAAACLVAAAPATPASAQAAPDVHADSILTCFIGRWRLTGEVRGQPVAYDMTAERTLNGRFVELHMVDSSDPPRYEARVIIGADTGRRHVIAHWLDTFGAAFSVPPGVGSVSGDTIVIDFPYPAGAFRDTFVHDSRADSWKITLLSRDAHDSWQPFASYTARRSGR
jgi:hypothetical protein